MLAALLSSYAAALVGTPTVQNVGVTVDVATLGTAGTGTGTGTGTGHMFHIWVICSIFGLCKLVSWLWGLAGTSTHRCNPTFFVQSLV